MAQNNSVLIIDDEPDIRELLEITLGRMGINTDSAADIASAKNRLSQKEYDLCLTDMNLPDGNGIDLVKLIQNEYPNMPVAMITAYGSMDTAIEALKAGAFDFVSKPIELERLRKLINSALTLGSSDKLAVNVANEVSLFGETDIIENLRKQTVKLARSQAPVLISGESGSGKELFARLIHANSPRNEGPFVAVNCGAIPAELMESEFFGHIKGSFTGATEDKSGLFQAAEGGTLFLDEVADLPLAMQVKLLRAIQEKAVRPIGGHQEIATDVRILSATHKNLAKEVDENRFRNDLYYRINVIELKVPSLRERRDDIPLLIDKLLEKISQEWEADKPNIEPAALEALLSYQFPGNVRELENVLERAYTLCENNTIKVSDLKLQSIAQTPAKTTGTAKDLPPQNPVTESAGDATARIEGGSTGSSDIYPPVDIDLAFGSLEEFLESIERQAIERALLQAKWNKTAAAKLLGISFRALRYRLKKLDME